MPHDVTSWFVDQTRQVGSEPKRVFKIGTSDYSDRVSKWPAFKRTAYEIKAVNPRVSLANADGDLNLFFENTYTLVNTCTLEIGFTHPTSGDELITVFTGFLKDVNYPRKECITLMKDRLLEFTQKKVGESDVPVEFTNELPSDIAWTLCTCYGELSTDSATNPDIDYDSFLEWAGIFSVDNILCDAYYDGQKVTEALTSLSKMTDSAIWVEGDGKVNFKRFTNASSFDIVLSVDDEILDLTIDVESQRLVNRQSVGFDYAQESDYWQKTVFAQNTTSVNTFGLNEETIEDESIWFNTSGSALNLAQRKVSLLSSPPKLFTLKIPLVGIYMQLGETVRLVDSFYGITSVDAWAITEYEYNMNTDQMQFVVDGAATLTPFILDVTELDSSAGEVLT